MIMFVCEINQRVDDWLQSAIQLSVGSNSRLLCFCFTTLCDWLKNSRPFLNQSEVKLKPIVTCWHAFSSAGRRLHVYAWSSDWFIVLFASADRFSFRFPTLN